MYVLVCTSTCIPTEMENPIFFFYVEIHVIIVSKKRCFTFYVILWVLSLHAFITWDNYVHTFIICTTTLLAIQYLCTRNDNYLLTRVDTKRSISFFPHCQNSFRKEILFEKLKKSSENYPQKRKFSRKKQLSLHNQEGRIINQDCQQKQMHIHTVPVHIICS